MAVDLDAYVLAHAHEWQRLEQLTRTAEAQAAPRATSWWSATSRSPPTCRWSARPRPTRRWWRTCPRCSPKARNRAVGTRVSSWRGFARFFTERFPAALYRLRWWWLGCLAVNVIVDRGDDAVAARPPERRAEPALARPRSTSWSTRTSRATTASTPPATSPRRSGSTTSGSRRCAWRWGYWASRSSTCCSRTSQNLAIIGSIMHPPRPRPAFLGVDPAARAVGADRGLRGRGSWAPSCSVLGRTGCR